MNEIIPIEYLSECFLVDFISGDLIWKVRPRHHFETETAWLTINSRQAGKIAGTIGSLGYRYVGIRGQGENKTSIGAHRIVFAMFHGEWADVVDHFNGNTLDNSISNLRPATQGLNMKNQKRRNTNKSGVTGVRWYPRYSAWHSEGTYNYEKFHLGYHEDFFEAVCARKSWENQRDFTRRHGK